MGVQIFLGDAVSAGAGCTVFVVAENDTWFAVAPDPSAATDL
jgi:hypothetical protein